MPQSLSSILVHLVFSTKNREPFIKPALEPELHPYMATIFRALKSPSLAIDGTTDHVHILFCLGRVIKIADLVEEVKTGSSKWIKTKRPGLQKLSLAEGIRRVLDRPVKRRSPEALHPRAETTPSAGNISG
jgi:REP element-mobilizing transposase RayT